MDNPLFFLVYKGGITRRCRKGEGRGILDYSDIHTWVQRRQGGGVLPKKILLGGGGGVGFFFFFFFVRIATQRLGGWKL